MACQGPSGDEDSSSLPIPQIPRRNATISRVAEVLQRVQKGRVEESSPEVAGTCAGIFLSEPALIPSPCAGLAVYESAPSFGSNSSRRLDWSGAVDWFNWKGPTRLEKSALVQTAGTRKTNR